MNPFQQSFKTFGVTIMHLMITSIITFAMAFTLFLAINIICLSGILSFRPAILSALTIGLLVVGLFLLFNSTIKKTKSHPASISVLATNGFIYACALVYVHLEVIYACSTLGNYHSSLLNYPGHLFELYSFVIDLCVSLALSFPDIWSLDLASIIKVRMTLQVMFIKLLAVAPTAVLPLGSLMTSLLLLCWYISDHCVHLIKEPYAFYLHQSDARSSGALLLCYRYTVSAAVSYLFYLWITVPPGTYGLAAVKLAFIRFKDIIIHRICNSLPQLLEHAALSVQCAANDPLGTLIFLHYDIYFIISFIIMFVGYMLAQTLADAGSIKVPTTDRGATGGQPTIVMLILLGLLCLFGPLIYVVVDLCEYLDLQPYGLKPYCSSSYSYQDYATESDLIHDGTHKMGWFGSGGRHGPLVDSQGGSPGSNSPAPSGPLNPIQTTSSLATSTLDTAQSVTDRLIANGDRLIEKALSGEISDDSWKRHITERGLLKQLSSELNATAKVAVDLAARTDSGAPATAPEPTTFSERLIKHATSEVVEHATKLIGKGVGIK